MLSFTGSLKVFVALEACDLRRGHNGLLALVGEKLREDIRSGSLFVFTNKSRRLLKVLYWDGTELWLLCNSHAPQCACWFVFENSLSISSAFRETPHYLPCNLHDILTKRRQITVPIFLFMFITQ